jgi:hypothetical protein
MLVVEIDSSSRVYIGDVGNENCCCFISATTKHTPNREVTGIYFMTTLQISASSFPSRFEFVFV